MFGLVIVANSVIGIVQKVRARRTLDRLAVLSTPTARVVRDGSIAVVDVARWSSMTCWRSAGEIRCLRTVWCTPRWAWRLTSRC